MASCSGQLRGGGGWGGHNLSHELQLLGVIVYVYVNVNVEETSSNYINIEETSSNCMFDNFTLLTISYC